MNITTEKNKYKLNDDTSIIVTVLFDRNKEESFTLEIWIDNYSSTQVNKGSGSSTYEYSIDIPNELSNGNHTIYSKFSDDKTFVSNTVSVEFEYEIPFSLELSNLERSQYNKTIDKSIKVSGSGIYSEDFSIYCSIGDINSTFEGNPIKNPETHTFAFSGYCLIPDSIVNDGFYPVRVWATTTNTQESTEPKSQYFDFFRNYPVLIVSDTMKETYYHNVDNHISVSGFVSDLDCDDFVTVKSFIEGYPTSEASKSISIPDSNNHSFNIEISIPNNLSRGIHHLIIVCCDKTDKCVSFTKSISYEFARFTSDIPNIYRFSKKIRR
ncbi:hypothetical protein TVAG_278210 [Trichomonas vaginalis G3]|uniref:Uncharacterized protein n=1 Tax=Trichomonas vaginalis (strain ATCC PRA-98 / G3) TaxID=412133 RepID=A2DU62_TRIV3|nr:hypothetical protein TVAGG3_0438510 [Trichomonas vaginalis G3]EAY16055.1 hypothetical protein TVAG_278210 [Trichomonas vaginalis G3]KAI5537281.1 hypothetical protein TVAGG3_0438510 [Trichomonas vaginalis G3]|eukprot:XP_001328278.1 hypothetical protein [Trichomonas vaginalis G3]